MKGLLSIRSELRRSAEMRSKRSDLVGFGPSSLASVVRSLSSKSVC